MSGVRATARFYAYISGSWTLLQDVAPIRGSWGISSNSPVARVADVGEMYLQLNNASGQYSPNGPSALAGWGKGIPLKLVVTYDGMDYVRFRGVVSDIQIKPHNADKLCYVTVLDWLDYAQRHSIVNPGILADVTGDGVITELNTLIGIPPATTKLDTGSETFPTALDTVTSHTTAYDEFAKVALSELGYVYLRKDATNGEQLVFESADARYGWKPADEVPLTAADSGFLQKEDGGYLLNEDGGKLILNQSAAVTFDGSLITDFDAPYGAHVINRMNMYAYPRRLDTTPQILFRLNEPLGLASSRTKIIKGNYANPSGGLPINAQDMIAPVATTDYLAFANKNGTGTNLTANISVVTSYGTEGFSHRVTNNGTSKAWITLFNCRGTGIYLDNPIEDTSTDSPSIASLGEESEYITQKYKNDLDAAGVFADAVVEDNRTAKTVLNSVSLCANKSSACMMAFLNSDVGTLRYISIPEAGIAGNYYIQGIEFEMKGGIIMFKWIVRLALALGVGTSSLSVQFSSLGVDGVNFGYLPRVGTLSQRTFSAWIYQTLESPASPSMFSIFSTFGDTEGQFVFTRNPRRVYYYTNHYTGWGEWSTPDNVFSLNAWTHVVVSYVDGVANDPVIYVNGTAQVLTEVFTPSGTAVDEIGRPLIIGNAQTSICDYCRPFDGKIYDARIYNRVLTQAEVTALYNSGTPLNTLVRDGLVFQAFAVPTGDLASYIGATLTDALKLRDSQFGAVGVSNGSPIGRAAP